MTISCDYDPAQVYSQTTVMAAKDHRCCECQGTIKKGERHELVKGLWDGGWSAFRTCPDCVHLRCELTSAYGDGCGWLHGGMIDQIETLADYARYGDQMGAQFVALFNATAVPRGAKRIEVQPHQEATK